MAEFGPIGRQVFERTYSRTKDDGTKETFDEVVARMVRGNCDLDSGVSEGEKARLTELITQHKLVPAGRHWWVSGVPGRQFLFNCHRAGWTDQLADHVGFTFNELMKGGGVGANYSREYMERMHRVRRPVFPQLVVTEHVDQEELFAVDQDFPGTMAGVLMGHDLDEMNRALIVVDDSREGWVYVLEQLCRLSQLEGPATVLELDFSRVRPRGSRIHGFGGTASGPAPLFQALVDVSRVLNQAVGRRITGLEAMEIDQVVAQCVVAGNVRRSARMSMMHWEDPDIFEFMSLKRYGGHWTTNMSVEVDEKFWAAVRNEQPWACLVLDRVAEGMHRNGEPGIYDSSNASRGERGDVRCTNPCGEIALEEWENCNLGHVNLARVEDLAEFDECARLMGRWLVRATLAKGSDWRQWEVVQRNRRIGVGVLGFQEWAYKQHEATYRDSYMAEVTEDFQAVYYGLMAEVDGYCDELKIAHPIKLTCVAPTGTVAKISGVTEGIHPVYSRYFIRRVRFSVGEPGLLEAIEQGLPVEPDVNNPNTMVVSYHCRDSALDTVPETSLQASADLSIHDKLRVQEAVQRAWADNAVSYTVNFDPQRYPVSAIVHALKLYGPRLKGTTFMPEGSYAQAPLERISRQEYEAATTRFSGSSAEECVGACPVR